MQFVGTVYRAAAYSAYFLEIKQTIVSLIRINWVLIQRACGVSGYKVSRSRLSIRHPCVGMARAKHWSAIGIIDELLSP